MTNSWREIVLGAIAEMKERPFKSVAVDGSGKTAKFRLQFLTREAESDRALMELLGRWRKENEHGFLGSFPVSYERTHSWYLKNLINQPDRLLFLIEVDGKYVGHIGLFRFNYETKTCEIDNIVRGEKDCPGIMGDAILAMMQWGRDTLGLSGYGLKVLGDNDKAIRLYKKLGYTEVSRIPLLQEQGKDGPEWKEAPAGWTGTPERYYSVMAFKGESK